MNPIILDCSLCMTWAFEDERNPLAVDILDSLTTRHAWAPQIWPLEMANALLVALRRKRISTEDARRFVDLIDGLPVTVDSETAGRALHETFKLAETHRLSAYDVAYLELAMRKGYALATLDTKMRNAAQKLGIGVI